MSTKEKHKYVSRLVGTIVLCFLCGILMWGSKLSFIPTESMANTIPAGALVYSSMLPYAKWGPQRFDIVIFEYALDRESLYTKRVIGLPGEHVEITDGQVIVDGEVLTEDYLPEEWLLYNDGYIFDVPEDSYLVLGDNRNVSFDARFWREEALSVQACEYEFEAEKYAYVSKEDIKGKVLWELFPYFGKVK